MSESGTWTTSPVTCIPVLCRTTLTISESPKDTFLLPSVSFYDFLLYPKPYLVWKLIFDIHIELCPDASLMMSAMVPNDKIEVIRPTSKVLRLPS